MKNVKFPDYFTYLNAACGLLSIFFSINLMFNYAILLMLVATFFDFLDGRIAKMINRQGNFGKELDSLADIVSFGVAPIIFGLSYLDVSRLSLLIYAVFLFAGLTRLAKYNIAEAKNHWIGMPITMNAILVPIFYLVLAKEYLIFIYLAASILMVSPFKIKRF